MVAQPPNDETVDPNTMGRAPSGSGRQSYATDPLVGYQLGDYRIDRVLGRGGMGSVYEATHLNLQKSVAIKVLAPHLLDDPRAVERFRREMRAIGRLNSPFIVQALDASLTGDMHYLVMEYIDGIDADELISRLHGIPVEDACEIVRQVALGLADAHHQQLVHRDIKPKNIAVDANGRVKILDLGLALCKAEMLGDGRLTAQAAIGSYQYMAPEQFDDSHDVDIRADLYSLGCTLFHLLTGHPPFSGTQYRSLTSLMEAHRRAEPPAVVEVNRLVPSELDAVVRQLLAKSPEDRLDSPEKLAHLLEPFTKGARLVELVKMARQIDIDTPTMHGSPSSPTSTQVVDRSPFVATAVPRPAPTTAATRTHRKRNRRRLMIGGLVALAITAVAVGYSEYNHRQLRAMQSRTAQFVQLVPGLNGNWWLDEYPWLLPTVRVTAAESLAPDSTGIEQAIPPHEVTPDRIRELTDARAAGDVPTVDAILNDAVAALVTDGPAAVRDSFFFIRRDDPESVDDDKLRGKLERVAELHRAANENPTVMDEYVLAVVSHWQGRWPEAEASYQKALASLEQIKPTPKIWSLCSADYGELLSAMGKFDDAALRFRLAIAKLGSAKNESPEFALYAYCREADCLRRTSEGSRAQDSLEEAKPLIDRLGSHHPLVAFYEERQGWQAFEDWRIDDAAQHFQDAITIRQHLIEQGNKRAQRFLFLNEQGLGMVERFRGETGSAKKLLTDLADRLAQARDNDKSYSAKQRYELRNRYMNTLERLTDIPLFGDDDPSAAVPMLKQTLEFAVREGADDPQLARHIDRVRYKLAIALASAGQVDQAEETIRSANGLGLTALEKEFRDLAQAAVALKRESADAGERLAALITAVDPDQARRDEIDFGLLACKIFYQQARPNPELLTKVVRREWQWARSVGRQADTLNVLRYLRPHFDAMITHAMKEPTFPNDDLARIMLHARQPSFNQDLKNSAVFYFTAHEGFVLRFDENLSAERTNLPFGADDVHSARKEHDDETRLRAAIPTALRERVLSLPSEQVQWEDPGRDIEPEDRSMLFD